MKEFKLFATLIQVAFIVMKLCGAIHWSWLLGFFTNFAISCMDGFQIRFLGFLHKTRNQKESRELS